VKRTTIFLPDEVHDRLRHEAFEARVSMAHLIRSRLERRSGSRRKHQETDPLAKVEGIVRDGALSRNIDEALYSAD
jgi:hypothetical protein